ncbi:methyltransferase domain-containing protein [bacterium]|nr:methyltransferase domain-containing protein [bacterium]
MSIGHRNYFNELATEWDSIAKDDNSLKGYLTEFGLEKDDAVLDVGAGTGRMSRCIADIVGEQGIVISHDFALDMLERSQSKGSHDNIYYLCNDIHSLCFKNNLFDKIICFSAFPHFIDQQKAVNEIYRVLKPSGKLLIFHRDSSDEINKFHFDLSTLVSKDVLPEAEELSQMLEISGFKVIKAVDTDGLYWVEGVK